METTAIKGSIKYDGLITISVGNSRKSINWKTKTLAWSALIKKLGTTTYTSERYADFLQMSKMKQDEIKDVGGFVGGDIKGKRRKADCMGNRQLVTLDADYAPVDLWQTVGFLFDNACLCYSTHKHCKDKPRLRLVFPLDRPVTPDEYQAVSRKIAEQIGIDYFDDTTYQPHRLMYYPSTSKDGEFVFHYQDGKWLSVDKLLASYEDWTEQSSWPVSSRMATIIDRGIRKQENPLEKKGLIGSFCRTYTIPEAMDEFLEGVYEKCQDNRYTYTKGSTSGGAIVYDDMFLYSHHSTDPCTMQLVNAFDMVRIHLYGDLDDDKNSDDIKKLPSYKTMCELVSKDKNVKVTIAKERMEEAGRDFSKLTGDDESGTDVEPDMSWTSKLECNEKTGAVLPTRTNYVLILENDPLIKNTFGMDEFSRRICMLKKAEWHYDKVSKYLTDDDGAALREIIERFYKIDSRTKFDDSIIVAANKKSFHAVKDWLNLKQWDGVQRVDTMFIDYLGAEDTPYVRAVTRKMLVAAVARVMEPGCKYDSMVVLEGSQGLGKSYLLKKLGGKWFSDSLSSMQGKEAYEQLRGIWIAEMAELATMRRNEVESVKQFISKQVDTYRVSYGRSLTDFPRQCIFVGTTNESTFLKDRTGNRRFLPVKCGVNLPSKSLFSKEIDSEISQIWAEAVEIYKQGEPLILTGELEQEAKKEQRARLEDNPLEGQIQAFLEKKITKNWYTLDICTRRDIMQGNGYEVDMKESQPRYRVCSLEVWCEMLGGDPKNFGNNTRKEIQGILENLEGWKLRAGGKNRLSFGKDYGQQRSYVLIGGCDDE